MSGEEEEILPELTGCRGEGPRPPADMTCSHPTEAQGCAMHVGICVMPVEEQGALMHVGM